MRILILITQAQDLKALLGVYQLWAHQMFPRGDFMGTVTRVENVLRTRRMEVSPYTCCVPLHLPSSVLRPHLAVHFAMGRDHG